LGESEEVSGFGVTAYAVLEGDVVAGIDACDGCRYHQAADLPRTVLIEGHRVFPGGPYPAAALRLDRRHDKAVDTEIDRHPWSKHPKTHIVLC